jgi:rod shape determining protein RodA
MKEYLKEHFDFTLFCSVCFLTVIGLISIYSSTYSVGLIDVFNKQIIWVVAGFVVLPICLFIPIKYVEFLAYPIHVISLIILAMVPFIGQTVYGSTSWINFGFFKIQPSEFTKVTTVIALAFFLSNKNVNIENLKYLMLSFLIAFVPFCLIMLQPDFGTATVYMFTYFLIVFWSGTKLFYIYTIIAFSLALLTALISPWALLVLVVVSILILIYLKENLSIIFAFSGFLLAIGFSFDYFYKTLAPHQQKRIIAFLNPDSDPLGAGYNAIQAKVAIGSGGLFGKGFMQGTQTQLKFIPKQWTDFIFCVTGEEFGFLGAMIVIMLLFLVLFQCIKISKTTKSRFASIVTMGFVAILLYQIVVNLGMSMNILPVMGIPLPFISSGGSSFVSIMIMIGLMLNFYSHRKDY